MYDTRAFSFIIYQVQCDYVVEVDAVVTTLSEIIVLMPPDVALFDREKILGCQKWHCLPATLSWNWF